MTVTKKKMFKDIISSLKELISAMEDIRKSIRQLDFGKLPKLLKKESQIIGKLEKYSQIVQNEQSQNDINNMKHLGNVLPFPKIISDGDLSDEIGTIRHLYGELIRKVFIIGNLVEQHINIYRLVYCNLYNPKISQSPKIAIIDKKM